MVTFIPGYVMVYAFSQFEHRRRHWIVPGLLGALALAGVSGSLVLHRLSELVSPTSVPLG